MNRRSFIKSILATGIAALAPGSLLSDESPTLTINAKPYIFVNGDIRKGDIITFSDIDNIFMVVGVEGDKATIKPYGDW